MSGVHARPAADLTDEVPVVLRYVGVAHADLPVLLALMVLNIIWVWSIYI
jgi:phosphotransferase system HPr-like phosphotransfer protein